eukprot:1161645-Pelagomonas_calceolata.AAC.15
MKRMRGKMWVLKGRKREAGRMSSRWAGPDECKKWKTKGDKVWALSRKKKGGRERPWPVGRT